MGIKLVRNINFNRDLTVGDFLKTVRPNRYDYCDIWFADVVTVKKEYARCKQIADRKINYIDKELLRSYLMLPCFDKFTKRLVLKTLTHL